MKSWSSTMLRTSMTAVCLGGMGAGCGASSDDSDFSTFGETSYTRDATPVEHAPAALGALSLQPEGGIRVVTATYGANCGAPSGNETVTLGNACDGREICDYRIDHRVIGDPARGCAKNYTARWTCPDGRPMTRVVPAEASGDTITLSCAPTVRILSATYGRNCGASQGNQTSRLRDACQNLPACEYLVDHRVIGDPAVGCRKEYIVEWECSGGGGPWRSWLAPEASGKRLYLTCG